MCKKYNLKNIGWCIENCCKSSTVYLLFNMMDMTRFSHVTQSLTITRLYITLINQDNHILTTMAEILAGTPGRREL